MFEVFSNGTIPPIYVKHVSRLFCDFTSFGWVFVVVLCVWICKCVFPNEFNQLMVFFFCLLHSSRPMFGSKLTKIYFKRYCRGVCMGDFVYLYSRLTRKTLVHWVLCMLICLFALKYLHGGWGGFCFSWISFVQ